MKKHIEGRHIEERHEYKTLRELRDEAFRESVRPKALLEHTWAAGVVLFIVCLVAMTIGNLDSAPPADTKQPYIGVSK